MLIMAAVTSILKNNAIADNPTVCMYKFIDLSIHLVRYRSQSLHGTWIFFGEGVVYVVEFKSMMI